MNSVYRTGKHAIGGLAIALFLLVCLEGSARLGYLVLRGGLLTPPERYWIYSPELMWEFKPGFLGKVGSTERHFDAEGFLAEDSAEIHDESKPKVVFIGDSSTFGFGVSTEATFVEVLERRFPAIQAINLGVLGYSSYQGYQTLLKRGLALDPDILVISFNFNDRRYVLTEDRVDSARHFRREYRKQVRMAGLRFLEYSYISHSLRLFLKRLGLLGPQKINIEHLSSRVPPEAYRENLRQIVETAQANGIEVLLLILKDSPVATEALRKGVDALHRGDPASAITSLTAARTQSPWFSDLADLYLVKAYRADPAHDDDAENALLLKAPSLSLHGGLPIYLDSTYTRIMEEVAATYHVDAIDAAQVLDASDYLDFCHPTSRGHQKIAALLHERIAGLLSARESRLSLRHSTRPR